jgi:hypothetical protein
MLGLIGGPLIFASAIAVLFGAYEQDGAHFFFSIPEIAFEASITVYCIWKRFQPSPILDDDRYAGQGQGLPERGTGAGEVADEDTLRSLAM